MSAGDLVRLFAFLNWAGGRLPDHRPSHGELLLAAAGWGVPQEQHYHFHRR